MTAKELGKEKREFQAIVDKLRKRRSEFVEARRAARKKETEKLYADTGADPTLSPDLTGGLTLDDISDIEKINETIAAHLERLRRITIEERREALTLAPAQIDELTRKRDELKAQYDRAEKELKTLTLSTANEENNLNTFEQAPHRVINYPRQMTKLLDERIPEATRRAFLNDIFNY